MMINGVLRFKTKKEKDVKGSPEIVSKIVSILSIVIPRSDSTNYLLVLCSQ